MKMVPELKSDILKDAHQIGYAVHLGGTKMHKVEGVVLTE